VESGQATTTEGTGAARGGGNFAAADSGGGIGEKDT
jgi:hypothetical protein